MRHVFQHLGVAAFGFLITYLITKFPINLKNISLFVLFSFLPDLDGATSIFIWANKIPMAKETVTLLQRFKIKEALSYGAIHHKKLNRLIVHNVIAYPILWSIFVYSIIVKQNIVSIVLASTLTHLTFDLFDDIKQLGHIKNWLWMFAKS